MRKAFTLIELLISIVILSIVMLFLYKSYAGLNKSNQVFEEEIQKVSKIELLKKVIYLDFSMAQQLDANSTVKILNQEKDEDVVFLQTSNSIHERINPYVAYLVKEDKLYRLESLNEFREYPLGSDSEFVVDELGSVKSFRVYKSNDSKKELYLIHIDFKEKSEILLKVKVLNAS
ncbi:MAG: prepilin-type N-terminal cleavage/methylation domain-containing protein [Campylobacterota bacterium]|nr:prepilin-type N-terminal cleavage/methylation domain-containing protein [Campylobacterota bacterium]